VVFYRIATELLNNTIQHAQASVVTIRLNLDNVVLILRYEDDGVGFEADKILRLSDREGTGLPNILSRIKSLKGDIKIDSRPGLGSRFYISVNTDLVR